MRGSVRRPRRHAPAAERRRQILAAALRCFGEKGYHEATMDDLVAACGLSKGSLYWHFRSKEEVFLALFDAFAEEVFEAWEGADREDQAILARLRRQGELTLERLAPALPLSTWAEFFAHPEARRRFARVYDRARANVAEWIRRGIERGELREVPAEPLAAALVAAIEGLLLQTLADAEFDALAHWPAIFDVLARGLEAPGSDPPDGPPRPRGPASTPRRRAGPVGTQGDST
jgi:AcrR family transcriptional regulator